MKKTIGRLAMLILTVCMIVCMIPNVSFNASAALADHANHCICGGGVTAGGHQCSDFAEWKPLDLTDTVTWINGYQTQVSGSYYLTEDIVLDENDAGLEFHSEQEPITVNICLNGHKIKRIAGDGMSCLSVQPESTVNICDCGGSGEIINETSHAIANQGTLNFYSGAAYSSGQYKAAILCTVNDQVKNSGSTCNFYGGKLDSNGETVRLRDGAVFTVEDGTISGTCPIRLDGGTCEIKGGSLISKGKYCISVNDTLAYPPTDPPTVLAAARLYISGTPTLEGESTANIYLDTVPAETAADAPIISCSRSGKAYAGDELSISLGKTSQAPGYLIGGVNSSNKDKFELVAASEEALAAKTPALALKLWDNNKNWKIVGADEIQTQDYYNVIYDANGGVNAPVDNTEYPLETSEFTILSQIPTKDGKAFSGWLEQGDTSNRRWPGDKVSFYSGDPDRRTITMVAQWGEQNVSVTTDGVKRYYSCLEDAFNNAPNGSTIVAEKSYPDGSDIMMYAENNESAKDLTLDLNGKRISMNENDGGIIIVNGSLKITGDGEYLPMIQQSGGNLTIENSVIGALQVIENEAERTTLLNGGTFAGISGIDPSLDGKGIIYMATESDATTATNALKQMLGENKKYNVEAIETETFDGGILVYISAPVSVEDAAPLNYTITFNGNEGIVSTVTLKTDAEGKVANLPTPTRSGYDFNGWYTALSGGTKVTSEYVFTAHATVYAQWTKQTTTEPPTNPNPTDPPVVNPPTGDGNGGDVNPNPKTGDNSMMWLWIAILAVSGGAIGGIVYSKRKNKEE